MAKIHKPTKPDWNDPLRPTKPIKTPQPAKPNKVLKPNTTPSAPSFDDLARELIKRSRKG